MSNLAKYNTYVGARYVPVIDGDWDISKEYEPLTVVTYQGSSYTSKTFVPSNTPINDTKYWVRSADYNAQVEAYREEVETLKDEKLTFITPEMFGATGDGITDDTNALRDMIDYIESILPTKEYDRGATSTLDWSSIRLVFNGEYSITDSLEFDNLNNLSIDGLKLKALVSGNTNFSMLKFGIARNLNINNSFIDANFGANIAIEINDYTIGSSISNTNIHGFLTYGFKATNNGHEVKFNNVRIEQRLWEEMDTVLTHGIGISLSSGQEDYKFNNVVISYCAEHGIDITSGANFFSNVHVYGCDVVAGGRYNFFENCYFDRTISLGGYFTLINSYFSMSANNPIIVSTEDTSNLWAMGYGKVLGNTFISSVNITKFFEDSLIRSYYPLMLENAFQNVQIIVNKGNESVFGEQFKPEVKKTYDSANIHSFNIGNLVVFYGTASNVTGSAEIVFDTALSEVLTYSACGSSSAVACGVYAWTGGLTVYGTGNIHWNVIGKI